MIGNKTTIHYRQKGQLILRNQMTQKLKIIGHRKVFNKEQITEHIISYKLTLIV